MPSGKNKNRMVSKAKIQIFISKGKDFNSLMEKEEKAQEERQKEKEKQQKK